MDHFAARDGVLHAEDVPLPRLAERFGTPAYVYSRATIERHVRVLEEGMRGLDHLVCYAVKANGNLALLDLLLQLGCGLDAVSLGELARALKVAVPPDRLIVSGVGKRDDEIAAALRVGVLYIGVESEDELLAVSRIASAMGTSARVALRVNPDVDASTHPHIATGLKENKFGVPIAAATALFARGVELPGVRMIGVTCHIGSQITTLAPFADAAARLATLARDLRALGAPLELVGMGGGLGIPYGEETPPSPRAYGEALTRTLAPLGLRCVLEPGRVIVGNAGVLLCRVVRVKTGADRTFVILDGGMNDLLRPALYDAHHTIEPVTPRSGTPRAVDVVGPVCETADTFARGRVLPPLAEGDLVAIRGAGAYGFAMSSTYNGRPRAAEVLCSGATPLLVRERERLTDLWRGEHRLSGLAADSMLPQPLVEDPHG